MRKADREVLYKLLNKYDPSTVQKQLAKIYEYYSVIAKREPEVKFWFRCAKASMNLSSGMRKWAHTMIDELETGEMDVTEGG